MADNGRNEGTALAAFVAGAALGAVAALLLTPKTGKEVREKLGEVTEEAVDKLKCGVKEAKFKVSKKTPEDAFRYEGGDCWV